jgi:hypothetical protein
LNSTERLGPSQSQANDFPRDCSLHSHSFCGLPVWGPAPLPTNRWFGRGGQECLRGRCRAPIAPLLSCGSCSSDVCSSSFTFPFFFGHGTACSGDLIPASARSILFFTVHSSGESSALGSPSRTTTTVSSRPAADGAALGCAIRDVLDDRVLLMISPRRC